MFLISPNIGFFGCKLAVLIDEEDEEVVLGRPSATDLKTQHFLKNDEGG